MEICKLVYLTHRMALPVLQVIRKPEIFPYTRDALKKFPDNTLGKDLASFFGNKTAGPVTLSCQA